MTFQPARPSLQSDLRARTANQKRIYRSRVIGYEVIWSSRGSSSLELMRSEQGYNFHNRRPLCALSLCQNEPTHSAYEWGQGQVKSTRNKRSNGLPRSPRKMNPFTPALRGRAVTSADGGTGGRLSRIRAARR